MKRIHIRSRFYFIVYMELIFLCFLSACTTKDNILIYHSSQVEEQAEDILLKAHLLDTNAVIKTSTGYMLGIYGFPKDALLSFRWFWGLADLEMRPEESFLSAMILQYHEPEGIQYDSISTLELCLSGMNSFLVNPYQESEFFDFPKLCAQTFAYFTEKSEFMEVEQQRAIYSNMDINLKKQYARALEQPLSEKKRNFLGRGNFSLDSQLPLWYAATTHNPVTQSPDWKVEHLLSLLKHNPKAGEEILQPATVKQYIFNKMAFDPALVRDIIRRAHAGDAPTMREMAVAYQNGTHGFPENHALAEAWLNRAVEYADVPSMLILASQEYSPERYSYRSRTFALLAWMYGEGETRESAKNILQLVEKNMPPEERGKNPWYLDKYLQEIQKNTGKVPLSVPLL